MKKTLKLLCVAVLLVIGMVFAALSVGAVEPMVSLENHYNAAIKTDGSFWLWGYNYYYGQLGDGTNTDRYTPVKILDNVASVSLGYSHSAAIKTDGSLWLWGYNANGQLGDGTTTGRHSPVKILDNVASVSLGEYHSAAIKTDGSLWLWGYNFHGQLGDGTTTDRHTPVKILDNVASVSLGHVHSAAIKTDGSLWMWGYNEYGQLGDGTTTDRYTPVKILDNVASVSLGENHSAAIKTDGSLWLWGYNSCGKLGDGTTTRCHTTPVKILDNVASVSLGWDHSAAIKTDGSLWLWGDNYFGQLGDGTTTDRHTPVKILDNVASVSLGNRHSAAIKTDGSLWLWGDNEYGQLGDGTTTNRRTPVKIMDLGAVTTTGKLQITGETKIQAQKSTTLTATYTDNNGNVDTSGSIAWSCSDASVLQITPAGNTATVKGLKGGKATVTATHSSGVTESVEITVEAREIKVFVNNVQVNFYPQEPYLDEAAGRTLVPVRQVLEAMGATVDWDEENQIVKIHYLNRYILLFIDKYTMFVNGKSKPLDIAPKIMNNRTMIPVRAVAEACDCEVVWDEVNYHIYITVDENKENSLLNITCENKTYNGNLNSPDMVSASISVENMSSDIVVVVLNGEGNKVIKAKSAKNVIAYLDVPKCMEIIGDTGLSFGELEPGDSKTKSVDIRFTCYKNADCKNDHTLQAMAVAEGFEPIEYVISITKPKYVDPFVKLREEAQKASVDRATQAVKIADTLCENTQNKISNDTSLNSYRERIKNEITIGGINGNNVRKDDIPNKIYDIFFREIKTALDEASITKYSIDPIKLTNQVIDMIQKGMLSYEESFVIDGISYSISIHGAVNSGNGYAVCTVNSSKLGAKAEYDIIWSNYGSEDSLNGIKEFANALDNLNTDLWKDACAKLVSDGLGLAGFDNITAGTVTQALNASEKIVYALCDEKAADKLLDELGGKMKEELKTWRSDEFEKFVKDYVPNGELLINAAEKYKTVASKYDEWAVVLNEGSDLDKAIQLQKEFDEAYKALNSILLAL